MSYKHALTIATGFTSALRALEVDDARQLYAAGDSAIRVFDRRGGRVRQWTTALPPHAVAVHPDGRVFAGEAGQIEIFDASGRLLETWRDGRRLGRVTSIGFLGDEVIAGDAAARTLRRLDAHGAFVNDIGANNRMKGFQIPNGALDFAAGEDGAIHASNPGKHRVERHAPDDRLLDFFGRFDGIDPAGFSGCCNPTNVALHRGQVFVTEKADPRVKVYDASGRLLAVIASVEFDANCKNMDIAVDRDGRVYVADTVRRAVLAFEGDAEP
jgi:sugar lactone lactonase YvrE